MSGNENSEEKIKEPAIVCPTCGALLFVKSAKRYSLIDIVGMTFVVLFISGVLFIGIFGRYTAALVLAEIYVVIAVLPKFINYKSMTITFCKSCGFTEKKVFEEN